MVGEDGRGWVGGGKGLDFKLNCKGKRWLGFVLRVAISFEWTEVALGLTLVGGFGLVWNREGEEANIAP